MEDDLKFFFQTVEELNFCVNGRQPNEICPHLLRMEDVWSLSIVGFHFEDITNTDNRYLYELN